MIRGKSRSIHLLLLLVVTAVLIWSVIKPIRYTSWVLEAGPSIIGLIVVIAVYNKFRFTTLSYVIIAILAIMTFVGGHYTYTRVPLFDWIKDTFDLKRNHYDRFGHLLKGLFSIVIREILLRKTQLTRSCWLFTIVLSISLAIGALYEIIEWLVSKIQHGGKVSKDFLGTQGDIWDTQWDMLCVFIGSIVALLLLSKLHNRQLEKLK